MKLGIMQPYFLPYLGYFQLIDAVELFIVYDNIKYTKKGWINRNRLLLNESDSTFSLPLMKGSDYLNVDERNLSADFDRKKLLNKFKGAYARAPHFEEVFPVLEEIVYRDERNLFNLLLASIVEICKYLCIDIEIQKSSEIDIDHNLKGQERVLAICGAIGADTYINAIGGSVLYSNEDFQSKHINLKFIKSNEHTYSQFDHEFVPNLSIVDVMMFNGRTECRRLIEDYRLV